MVIHFLRTIIFLCSVCALGLQIYLFIGFLCKADKEKRAIGIKELPLFFILGSGVYAFCAMFLSISGIKSNLSHFWLLFAALSLINIVLYFKKGEIDYRAVILNPRPIAFVFLGILTLLTLNLILAMAFPQFDIDMLGHILGKAKLLTTDTYKDSVFIHDPLFANLHSRYPPFVPMVFNLMFLFGADTIACYQIVNYFILLLLGISVYGYLKKRLPLWQGILWFFILLSTKEYLYSQYIIDSTDVLLSLIFLLVILWLKEIYEKKDTFSLTILAVLTGLATLIKNEGIPFSIIVGLTFALVLRKKFARYLLIYFILTLPWIFYRQTLPLSSSPNSESLIRSAAILTSLGNFKYALALCVKILSQSWNLLFVIWIPSFLILLTSRYRKEALFCSFLTAAMLLLYIIIISVHVDRAVTYDKGFLRVLSHLYPIVFILAALATYTLQENNIKER